MQNLSSADNVPKLCRFSQSVLEIVLKRVLKNKNSALFVSAGTELSGLFAGTIYICDLKNRKNIHAVGTSCICNHQLRWMVSHFSTSMFFILFCLFLLSSFYKEHGHK